MTDEPDTSAWNSCDAAPPTEADPLGAEDVWVTARHAADVVDRAETWVRRQCRAGRLPCRTTSDRGDENLLVPLARLLDLAAHSET
jgi:hypothetical protein